jgi:hypothetical protein
LSLQPLPFYFQLIHNSSVIWHDVNWMCLCNPRLKYSWYLCIGLSSWEMWSELTCLHQQLSSPIRVSWCSAPEFPLYTSTKQLTGKPSVSPSAVQNILLYSKVHHLCGLVVRVLGCRSGGPGSIPGTTRKKT